MPEALLIDVKEASERLGISRATFYARIYTAGHLTPVRIGRSVRFRTDDIAELVERLATGEVTA